MRDPAIPAPTAVRLFDALPDVVFFVKDRQGRYTHVNRTLARRLGRKRPEELVGLRTTDLFPAPLNRSYAAQDRRVLAGNSLENQLEVHLFPDRAPGWCITHKFPLMRRGAVTGLVGISRDLGRPDKRHPVYARLRAVLRQLETHYDEPLRIAALAQLAGLSVAQLERQFQRVFQLTPGQMLARLRTDAAMRLLDGARTVAAVGQACGYSDQSAFTRQFRRMTGITPREYRALRR